jgi:hypothetical protein
MFNSDARNTYAQPTTTARPYVLITPYRSEAAYTEGTLQVVIAQTALPKECAIVSDSSINGTGSRQDG